MTLTYHRVPLPRPAGSPGHDYEVRQDGRLVARVWADRASRSGGTWSHWGAKDAAGQRVGYATYRTLRDLKAALAEHFKETWTPPPPIATGSRPHPSLPARS